MAFGLLLRRDVLFLAANEAPNLIKLKALAGQVADVLVVIGCEDRARIGQQLNQRVLAGAGEAGDRADAHTLDHHAEDLGALFEGECIHKHSIKPFIPIVKHNLSY